MKSLKSYSDFEDINISGNEIRMRALSDLKVNEYIQALLTMQKTST